MPSPPLPPRPIRPAAALLYTLLFGSGIYFGIFVAETYHEPLDRIHVAPINHYKAPIRRSRNLMAEHSNDRQHEAKQKHLRAEAGSRQVNSNDKIPIHSSKQKHPRFEAGNTLERPGSKLIDPPLESTEQEYPLVQPVGNVVTLSGADTAQHLATTSTLTSEAAKSPSSKAAVLATPLASLASSPMISSEITFHNLPFSRPHIVKTKLSKMYRTTKSIAGCLFIMDDTIRLLEWLAYHYTVLPLSHLMVAIDPNSKNADRIMEILDSWQGKIDIKAYRNDTEWLDLPWDYGYSRNIRSPNGKLMKWFREEKSEIYFAQVHKRRQNYFCVQCMRHMKEKGMDWTIITDSDEYLMFNYPHEQQEDKNLYDTLKRGTSASDVDNERNKWAPFRARLPAMETRATIADYIHQEKVNSKCIMFPGLQFTSYESPAIDVYNGVPEGVNPYNLVTLRHRKAGRREGEFSKTMVDVSNGELEDYTMETNINVHVPNKLLCGMNGNSGSRQDYISSIFRLHHYRTGTWESFIERAADRRANMTMERFMERNIEPQLSDDDIRPWITWFVEKVGMDEVKRLLVDPLSEAYSQYSSIAKVS